MRIKVNEIEDIGGNTLVRFESKSGNGVGCWKSNNKPIVNYQYDVEFDIEKSIEKDRIAFASENQKYWIRSDGESITLNGLIESVDDDGMTYFRLADDCIIMIESDIGSVNPGEWFRLELDYTDVKVFAQGS